MQAATVAIEDERFYRHGGVDYEGIARAAFKNLEAGKAVEGGSTITQQLVRNLYVGRERTLERKIREARLAEELEDRHSKRWILQSYLNSVPYGTVDGQTAVGVQAAAQTFFAKPAKNLTLEDSALLAGLPQSPSRLNPFQNPREALDRRNKVLEKMADLGYISDDRAQEARRAPLGVQRGDLYIKIREPFFFDYVKQQLIDRFGVNTVRKGGLKVYTTIDPKLQKAGREAIDSTLPYPGDPSSAVVAIDPRTGYIRAMASSSKYKHAQYNLAAQGHRQPGSAFKTFVLATAVKRGVNPYSTSYVSRPLDLKTDDYGPWKVQTYDQSYGGSMNLVRATLKSDNTVYAQLDLDLGPKSVAETAKAMGITTKLDGYPAEGLGGLTRGVSPLEMANAYATLASGGMRNKPIAILRVKFPDGEEEDLGKPKRERVLSDAQAYEVTKILKQNVTSGTGTRSQIGCPSAGKTGTTDNFNDAWFDGYTPHLATAVWVGYPDALREMRSVHGISVAGGTFPAEIWKKFMDVAKGRQLRRLPRSRRHRSRGRRSSAGTPRAGPATATAAETAPRGTPPAAAIRATIRASTTSRAGRPPRMTQQPGSAPGNGSAGRRRRRPGRRRRSGVGARPAAGRRRRWRSCSSPTARWRCCGPSRARTWCWPPAAGRRDGCSARSSRWAPDSPTAACPVLCSTPGCGPR